MRHINHSVLITIYTVLTVYARAFNATRSHGHFYFARRQRALE